MPASRLEEEIGGVDAPLRQLDAAGIVAITKQETCTKSVRRNGFTPKKWLPLHTERKNALEAFAARLTAAAVIFCFTG